MNNTIDTKFGKAKISTYGYYKITEGKYAKQFLHRLIFEDFYQIKLPSHIVIHHNDGNRLNNHIWNLIPMTRAEHTSLHSKTREISDETCKKISDALKGEKHHLFGKSHSEDTKTKMSISHGNTSSYFRVSKHIDKKMKQGFIWKYQYYENGKRKMIYSKDLMELKTKVLAKNLIWKQMEVEL